MTPTTTKTSRSIKAEDDGRCFCAFLTSVTLTTTVVLQTIKRLKPAFFLAPSRGRFLFNGLRCD